MLIQISKPYLQHIKITMQAVLSIAVPSLLPSSTLSNNKPSHFPFVTFASNSLRRSAIKATASVIYDTSVVDYSSAISVFPAEACETIGGEACCWANMFPEVRLQPSLNNQNPAAALEEIDREYLDYADSMTVFPGEACDDLGGEFCEPEFLNGVF